MLIDRVVGSYNEQQVVTQRTANLTAVTRLDVGGGSL